MIANHLPVMAYLPLVGGLVWATVTDLRSRRIPNEVCVLLWGGGLLVQAATGLTDGLVTAMLASLIGFAAMFPFYILGGFGAGDVKLMTAACAWLTLDLAVVAVGATLLIGGVLGLAVALRHLLFRSKLDSSALAGLTVGLALGARRGVLNELRGTRFPYAIAIALGTATAVVSGESILEGLTT